MRATAYALLLALFVGNVCAQEMRDLDKVVSVDVPAQAVSTALIELSREAGVQVIMPGTMLDGVKTRGVKGQMSLRQALATLLQGTALTFRQTAPSTITVTGGVSKATDSAILSRRHQVEPGILSSRAQEVTEDAGQQRPADADHEVLQEVIVTAQLYRQSAQEVPMSLDVISANELQQRGVTGLDDLQYVVPGMHVQGGGVQPRIFLRGVSNWNGNGSEVSQYIDDADITAQGVAGTYGYAQFDIPTYDLQRVEVLRGPQGTLYGAGAEGGTIRFITRPPVLDRFQTSADISASFMPDGAPSQRVEAMINTPVIPGDLGLRIVGDFDNEGGWIDEPVANIKNFNSTNIVNVRMETLWQPMRHLALKVTELIDRNSFGINHGEDAQLGVYEPVFGVTTPGHGQRQGNLTNIAVSYDLTNVRLLSSSTYFSRQFSVNDWALYTSPQAPPAYYAELYQNARDNDKDFSQEVRLSNTQAEKWQWTVGAFYQRDTDEGLIPYYFAYYGQTFVDPATSPLPPLSYSAYPRETSKSWAVFANISYRLFSRITLGAGGRYFRNNYDYMYPNVGPNGQLLGGPSKTATFTSSDPRFFVDARATQHVHAYVSAAKGFRSGGFNYTVTQPPFGPESVWSYELGTKMRFMDNRLAADEDIFYTDYKNYVVLGYFPEPDTPAFLNYINENVGKARIKGVEVNVNWHLLDNWSLGLNGDYLDAKLLSIGSAQGTGYAPGEGLPFVPKYSATASAQRDFQWNGKPGYAVLYYSIQAPLQYRQYGPPDEFSESDTIHMLNFSGGIQWNDSLRFGISAQNLLNDRGFVDPFHQLLGDWSARQRPRTYGVNMGVQFD